jgi:hypothetical protein
MRKTIAVLLIAILVVAGSAFTIYLPVVTSPLGTPDTPISASETLTATLPSGTATYNAITTEIARRQTATSAAQTLTAEIVGQTATFNAIATEIASQQTGTSAAKTMTAAPSPTATNTPLPPPTIIDSAMAWNDSVTAEITGHVQNTTSRRLCQISVEAHLVDKDGYTVSQEGIWSSGQVYFIQPGDVLPFDIIINNAPTSAVTYTVWVASWGFC